MVAFARPLGGPLKKLSSLVLFFLPRIGARDDQAVIHQFELGARGKKRIHRRDTFGAHCQRRFSGWVDKAGCGVEVGERDAKLHEPQ